MEAIVLAGGRESDVLAQHFGVKNKCLAPIKGRPMVDYTLEALAQNNLEIILVGENAVYSPQPKMLLADHGSMLANLEQALKNTSGELVLVSAGDTPFLTAEAVKWFLANSPRAGLVYSVVEKEEVEAHFRGMRRTYAKVGGKYYTGGNLFLVNRKSFLESLEVIKKAIALRKKPLALAGMIGVSTLLKVVLGVATIPMLERKVSAILGVEARALVTPYAGVGVDVDEVDDLKWID